MIKKAKFLAKEALLRVKYMTSRDCIFCKIVAGEIKTKKIYESTSVVAFDDINPVAKVHVLIVPKAHVESVLTVTSRDSGAIIDMFVAAQNLVKKLNLGAFRLAFNGGRFQHVPHLHWHLVSGDKIDWSKL